MRSKYLWKFKFFWDDVKNTKNDANVLKTYFFGFSMFFRYFWIFLKIYQNMGQKLGSNMDINIGLSSSPLIIFYNYGCCHGFLSKGWT